MKLHVTSLIKALIVLMVSMQSNFVVAQVCEWRLANQSFINTDPDGAGPATGQATFTLQIRTTGGTIANVNAISTGFSYQSANAMIPTNPGCATGSNQANIVLSNAFSTAGFSYFSNQCNVFNQTAGANSFDRRASGILDGGSINLTDSWVDIFTVTLWTLGSTNPEGGFVMINSGAGGAPGEFTTYAVADDLANEYVVNTLTYDPAISLGGTLPVTFTHFSTSCTDAGVVVKWSTSNEANASHYEIQRSVNGSNDWVTVGTVAASGQSDDSRSYQQLVAIDGQAFYRLRQVDADGRFSFTEIKQSSCIGKPSFVTLYPNPVRTTLHVTIRSEKSVQTTVLVYDMYGRAIRSERIKVVPGNNLIKIDVQQLPAGEYILRTILDGELISKKFIVLP